MKVVERIFEHRIRQQIVIDDMQYFCMRERWWYNKCTDLLNDVLQSWSTVGSPVLEVLA